ncbi:hypothetical protein GEMRC1_002558 [Eukaryota sp. GEM-RC1]
MCQVRDATGIEGQDALGATQGPGLNIVCGCEANIFVDRRHVTLRSRVLCDYGHGCSTVLKTLNRNSVNHQFAAEKREWVLTTYAEYGIQAL